MLEHGTTGFLLTRRQYISWHTYHWKVKVLTIPRPFGRQLVAWRRYGCHCHTIDEPCWPCAVPRVDLIGMKLLVWIPREILPILTWSKACHLIAILKPETISNTSSIKLFRKDAKECRTSQSSGHMRLQRSTDSQIHILVTFIE